jgi:hypothetical protein
MHDDERHRRRHGGGIAGERRHDDSVPEHLPVVGRAMSEREGTDAAAMGNRSPTAWLAAGTSRVAPARALAAQLAGAMVRSRWLI